MAGTSRSNWPGSPLPGTCFGEALIEIEVLPAWRIFPAQAPHDPDIQHRKLVWAHPVKHGNRHPGGDSRNPVQVLHVQEDLGSIQDDLYQLNRSIGQGCGTLDQAQ